MRRHRIVLPVCVALTACASHPPQSTGGGACQVVTSNSNDVYAGRLPKTDFHSLGNEEYYPSQAKREHQEGRVLARFRLDSAGRPVSPEFLQVEAPPVIAETACKLLHRIKFEVAQPAADTNGVGPFLVTVRYCLNNCKRMPVYPGSEDIAITGGELPR